MNLYLLKANICLSIFIMIYWLFLRNNTFYKLNRLYFLLVILISAILPLLNLSDFVNQHQEITQNEIIQQLPDLSLLSQNQAITEPIIQKSVPSNLTISINFQDIFEAIFFSGILVLLCKLIVQIISVFSILKRSESIRINGIKVRNLKENISPFSFFNLIFVNTNQHSEGDLSEIIAHEHTHATQGHSYDVMLVELFCIAFWINPFAWILRKFLKQNLEFLTDKTVVQSGFEVKKYQYNLLKINGLNISPITNSFNLSDLKMRIVMMNRKRSSNLHLIKYCLMIPIGAVIILAFNISKAKSFDVRKSVFQNLKETVSSIELKLNEPAEIISLIKENSGTNFDNNDLDDINFINITQFSVDSVRKKKSTFYAKIDILDIETHLGLKDAQIYDHKGELLGTTNHQGITIINYPEPYKSIKKDSIKIGEKYYQNTTSYHKILVKYKSFPEFELELPDFQKTINLVSINGKIELAKSKNISNTTDSTLSNSQEKPRNKKRSLYYLRSSGKLFIDPEIKLFYCKEDIIKELKKTQELNPDKRPVYLINTKQVPENYNFDDVHVNSIFTVQYWEPEYAVQIGQEFGKQCENGMYNLMLLQKDEEAYKRYKSSTNDKPLLNNLPKVERCTPSVDFPANALYVIDGKEVDSGYLHKNIKPEEIENLTVMDKEIARTKYGDKGKKGVILISTKKINKLH